MAWIPRNTAYSSCFTPVGAMPAYRLPRPRATGCDSRRGARRVHRQVHGVDTEEYCLSAASSARHGLRLAVHAVDTVGGLVRAPRVTRAAACGACTSGYMAWIPRNTAYSSCFTPVGAMPAYRRPRPRATGCDSRRGARRVHQQVHGVDTEEYCLSAASSARHRPRLAVHAVDTVGGLVRAPRVGGPERTRRCPRAHRSVAPRTRGPQLFS